MKTESLYEKSLLKKDEGVVVIGMDCWRGQVCCSRITSDEEQKKAKPNRSFPYLWRPFRSHHQSIQQQ